MCSRTSLKCFFGRGHLLASNDIDFNTRSSSIGSWLTGMDTCLRLSRESRKSWSQNKKPWIILIKWTSRMTLHCQSNKPSFTLWFAWCVRRWHMISLVWTWIRKSKLPTFSTKKSINYPRRPFPHSSSSVSLSNTRHWRICSNISWLKFGTWFLKNIMTCHSNVLSRLFAYLAILSTCSKLSISCSFTYLNPG